MTNALGGQRQGEREPAGPRAGIRWDAARVVVGACWVVIGGLVAAVTGPLHLEHGSWVAAYLVLVCGMAQCAFGEVRAHLDVAAPGIAMRWAHLLGWNLGNLAVIAGTLAGTPILSDAGGALLLIALVMEFRGVSGSPRRLLVGSYRAVLAILIVSIPIGSVLGHLGAV